ncbi:MAG: type I restriction-modification system subunit M N-terminal domain-containing protein [Chiayiivirga sp.]|jgi:type I restriction-modification system DNA methylase subunit|nr:type I restriction-modification system subunit M N-terminal domain-containing protein [Chiayiivirga sp.]
MTNDEFKSKLWDAADKLRGSVSAAQYKYPVLGLVFLKYVSDLFDAQAAVIRNRVAEPKSSTTSTIRLPAPVPPRSSPRTRPFTTRITCSGCRATRTSARS